VRYRAMGLQSALTLGRLDGTQTLVKSIADELSSEEWLSTQSTAYSLMAIAKIAGAGNSGPFTFERTLAASRASIVSSSPVYQAEIPDVPLAGEPIAIRNTSQRALFVTVTTRGVPQSGNDDASSSGLALDVSYTDDAGNSIAADEVRQGTDLIAHVEVKNTTSLRIDNIALTQIFPAGWEIHNDRLDEASTESEQAPAQNAAPAPSESSRNAPRQADYTDIRDDRVLRYFALKAGEGISFTTRLNAAYRGHYYLPSVQVEAMYDRTKNARTHGQWTDVVPATR
jgi:alpha-2-macroglobulin